MDKKNSNKRNATIDTFFVSSKKSREENSSTNITSNQSCSSSSFLPTSSITSNDLNSSFLSDCGSVDARVVHSTHSLSSKENSPSRSSSSSPSKSSSKSFPGDVSRTSQDPPSQPHLAVYPKDKDNRTFRMQWFTNRPWLEYSVEKDSTFCYYCRHFSHFIASSRFTKDVFTTQGFNNWKRALAQDRGFNQHVSSQAHIMSTANFYEYQSRRQSGTTVLNILDKSRAELIRQNRNKLIKISSAILLCAKQCISLRGHDESLDSLNRGNLIEILKWSSTTDPLAKAILEESASNATYLSHQIQNELLNIMANQIRDRISKKLAGNVYTLLADEAVDASHNKQLSICVRFVDDEHELKEYFLGFIRLHDFDAASLAKEIANHLVKHNISMSMCIAQCYDGAAVMSGQYSGVHAILQQNFMPKAIYIHCMAHRLNLVICHVCLVIPYIEEFFSILSNIHNYFISSGVTNRYFCDAQKLLKLDTTSKLKKWGNTRWDSRFKSIDAIKNNFPAIIKALEDLVEDGGSRAVGARGLFVHMKESMFIVAMFILHRLLGPIKILSDQLKVCVDLGSAKNLISTLYEQLNDMKNEKSFKELYEQIVLFGKENGVDLNESIRNRRQQTIPSRFKGCFVMAPLGHRDYCTNEDKFRTNMYFSTIDCILIELQDRLSCEKLQIAESISSLSPSSETFLDIQMLQPLIDHLCLDNSMIKNEISVIKPMLKNKTLSTVFDLLNELKPMKDAFPSTIELIKSGITFPVSSVTCERTFSKMKLIKTYARNSMGDERLSDLSILAIEKGFIVDFEKVVDVFATKHKNSRIILM
ncbi:unnamed protein product [Rotaria sp. Silwood2]|nr:unnamed protein product [Rotaria sp. Silwood2]